MNVSLTRRQLKASRKPYIRSDEGKYRGRVFRVIGFSEACAGILVAAGQHRYRAHDPSGGLVHTAERRGLRAANGNQ